MLGVFSQVHGVLRWLLPVVSCAIVTTMFSGIDAFASETSDEIYTSHFLLHQREAGHCLAVVDQSTDNFLSTVDTSANKVEMQICDQHVPSQRWLFDFHRKRIHPSEHGTDLCLTQLPRKLSIETCQHSALNQLWYFNQRDELFSRVGDPTASSRLSFNFVAAQVGDHHCYQSPFTGKVECPQFATDHSAIQALERRSWHWTGLWPWQPAQAKLTGDLQLTDSKSHRCLAVEQCHVDSINQYDCFGGAQVQVTACLPNSHQSWRHDLVSKRLFNKQAGEHFCLSWRPTVGLSLEHCSNTTAQKWYFARGKGRHYRHRGRLRWLANSEAQYDFIRALDFAPVIVFQSLDNPACGYDPVNGQWQGPCAHQNTDIVNK